MANVLNQSTQSLIRPIHRPVMGVVAQSILLPRNLSLPVEEEEEPAALFHDTFTDSDDVLITAHTPDIGSGWSNILSGVEPKIIGNVLDSQGVGEWVCDATQADCTITAVIHNGNSQQNPGIVFRSTSNANRDNRWMLWSDDTKFTLYRRVSGTNTYSPDNSTLGSNVNQTRSVEIVLSGSSILVTVDDTVLWDITDATHSTAAYHGIRFFNGAGNWIDDFKVVA